eukprot:TRINITY_DN77089_c0_g1_i1.p1 TRINITY_DN77089_c0_g1~~TRINITY_DN77089_c0_g1_i1.p1  ORF type:complete len:352 (-),score=53.95 TRINITY_DN77089_c0_g1_i1:67-1122(-)
MSSSAMSEISWQQESKTGSVLYSASSPSNSQGPGTVYRAKAELQSVPFCCTPSSSSRCTPSTQFSARRGPSGQREAHDGGYASLVEMSLPSSRCGSQPAPVSSRLPTASAAGFGEIGSSFVSTSCSRSSRGASRNRAGDFGEMSDEKVAKTGKPGLVVPPWSPERANLDHPPHETIVERRRQYHKLLDGQSAVRQERRQKADHLRAQKQMTSFETQTHTWGSEERNVAKERANFEELVATANIEQRRVRESREAERNDYARCAVAAERAQAMHYHAQADRRRHEMGKLAQIWQAAASEKRQNSEAERSRTLQEEKAMIAHLVEGMVPARRMKKPCVPPNHLARVIAPITAR